MTSKPPYPHVSELVPHVAPMLALEELLDWEPGRALATARLPADHFFMRRGVADSCVAIELITQAVAAYLGMAAFRRGDAVHVGMVVAGRRLELARASITPGEPLTIEVRCVRESADAGQFDGEVRDGEGRLVARGSFTLVYGAHLE